MNTYAYVYGNPLKWFDSTGKIAEEKEPSIFCRLLPYCGNSNKWGVPSSYPGTLKECDEIYNNGVEKCKSVGGSGIGLSKCQLTWQKWKTKCYAKVAMACTVPPNNPTPFSPVGS